MSEASAQRPSSNPPSTGLLIASTLCWLWGVIVGFSGVALLIPAMAVRGMGGGPLMFGVAVCVLAVAYCVAGYMLRRARLVGGWIAIVAASLLSMLQLLTTGARALSIGLLVNVALITLVVINWRYLRAPRSHVGA